jgi:phosphatidylserine decarboxylase
MRIPLTKYGMPQVVYYPSLAVLLILLFLFLRPPFWPLIEIILIAVLIWLLSFFRDPERVIVNDPKNLLSPADGTVRDIETVDDPQFVGQKAVRIGIFLSVFNVHINRAPCQAKVSGIMYKKGEFRDARHSEAGKVNESNDIAMVRLDEPTDKLLIRQISGAIARHIICQTKPGDILLAGQQFGMIKFGSRTELYFPAQSRVNCLVKVGDKVKAGLTVLARYE